MNWNFFRRRPAATASLRPQDRPLWRRMADTKEGHEILSEARRLSRLPEYADLTDGQLIRLAYWGATGDDS